MSPSEPSDSPWHEVRRGKQIVPGPAKTPFRGRGLGNRQPPSWVAARGPSLSTSKTQPALQAAPNGRVQPKSPTHLESAPKRKKEDIPYEIKNAREWDPNRRHQADFSSESSDDDDDDDDDGDDDDDDDDYDVDFDEDPHHPGDLNSTMTHGISQLGLNQHNPRPHGQPPSHPYGQPNHPKVHPYGKPQGPRRPHPRAKFNFKRDNLARAAFRKRLEPSGRFMLPKDCPEIEPNQKKLYDMFDEMGVRLGSFIRPPQHVKDRELLLWGDARQVQTTKAELERWLDNRLRIDVPRNSMAKDKFSKELSSIGDPYRRLMKKMQKEAKILEFQQAPAEGRVYPYTGTFLWPVDEVRPEDILGPSLEAFDPVRFQYHCHIIFDYTLSSFRIFSDKEDAIKKTINRIVGTMREYVAKSVRPNRIILIEPPSPSATRKNVKVLPLSLSESKAGQCMIPLLTGNTLDPQARNEWLDKSKEMTMKNNHCMELSLRKCIANLPHYRGLVRMRVQFGTFALKVYRWEEGADSTPLEEFIDNMAMPGTKGIMIRDLRIKKDATTILGKIQNASGLFLPIGSSGSLEDVVSSFSACFEFNNTDSPPMNFTLELSSSPAAPTIYEKVQELWTRTDRRDNAVPLEAFMVRIDSGASWKLQVFTENSIDSSRISPKMTEFAESVKLSKIPDSRTELTGQKVFTWRKNLPGIMQPSAFQQKTALRYRLAEHSEWEFEIARYDNYGNPKSENVPVETNWGATLYNTNWDSALTSNCTLGIGEAAPWSSTLETFLPSRSDAADIGEIEVTDPGVTEFLKVVGDVSKFIDSIKKELPHLRV